MGKRRRQDLINWTRVEKSLFTNKFWLELGDGTGLFPSHFTIRFLVSKSALEQLYQELERELNPQAE